MAKAIPKLNTMECLTCIVLGAVGASIWFMWDDIKKLWAP